jgi:cyclopropane-fatty-acyl-phospholipid synthase
MSDTSAPCPTAATSAANTPPAPLALAAPACGLLDRLARRAVLARLRPLAHGRLTIIDCDGTVHEFGAITMQCPLNATVRVRAPRFWSDNAFAGTIGAGESYRDSCWDCDDLTSLVRILVRDRGFAAGLESGLARLSAPIFRLVHAWNRNSRRGSRANITAHYDLGNDFFALWLDPTMMYSCAYFPHPAATLEEAAVAKLDRICAQLELKPGEHLLEIGGGWGGFAIHAATRYGCRVTTTTISREQHDLIVQRVAAAGLTGRIEVRLQDYRDLTGTYDKLVSIEMIEAVGASFYGAFFAACARLLKVDGLMVLQSITIADQEFAAACRRVDFIQRHIFPGSCIPSLTALGTAMTAKSDLRVVGVHDITPHYARTLELWRRRFRDRLDAVHALGYSAAFTRLWEFYLCYCAGGFHERAIGTLQMVLARPGYRQADEHTLNRSPPAGS